MNTCTYLCVHFIAYACTYMHAVYNASVSLMPIRKTQMKKMKTTRAVLKTVHC